MFLEPSLELLSAAPVSLSSIWRLQSPAKNGFASQLEATAKETR
jgi:hypothetical protein